MQIVRFKRITAWIAMIAILFVMLFSVFFITQHLDHDCTGVDCPVCAVMEQCSNNIKNIGTVIAIVAAFLLLYISMQRGVQCDYTTCCFSSLISQKVRMNN